MVFCFVVCNVMVLGLVILLVMIGLILFFEMGYVGDNLMYNVVIIVIWLYVIFVSFWFGGFFMLVLL